MRRWHGVVTLLGLLAAVPVGAMAQGGPAVEVRALRFYRADSRQTLVQAFVEVPYALLEATTGTGAGDLKYGVDVAVTDQGGVQLEQASWPGRAAASLRQAGASKLEILDFAVPAGRYTITVTVTDSVSGRHFTSSATVEGWSSAPRASDLMLSPSMRLATGDDTMPKLGELRRGNTLVTPVVRLKLTPVRTKAYYLVEAYAPAPDSGTMQVRLEDSTGKSLVTTRPARVTISSGGAVLKGQLDLAGLPAGRYRFVVTIDVGGTHEERVDELVMADFEETMQREEARLAALRETDEGYFSVMNDAQIDEAQAPLEYLTSRDSLKVYSKDLTLDAKRRFMVKFWTDRDPTPGTPRNEARERFYQLIDQANKTFAEGGRSRTPGWKTDRGRVFVKYGEPLDKLDRRTSTGSAPPYQVWRYQRGKELYYIFADRTGFGGYKLIATNDLKETQRPGYDEILGHEALQDISRWLGIDLFREGAGRTTTSPDQ